jgi:hypothetical protein
VHISGSDSQTVFPLDHEKRGLMMLSFAFSLFLQIHSAIHLLCCSFKSQGESRIEDGVDMRFSIDDLLALPDQTTVWDGNDDDIS